VAILLVPFMDVDANHHCNTPNAATQITDINMNPNQDDWVSFTAMDLAISPDGTYLLVASGEREMVALQTAWWFSRCCRADKSKLLLYKLGGSEQLRRFYGAENDMYSNPRCTWHPSGLYVYCTAQVCMRTVAILLGAVCARAHCLTFRTTMFTYGRWPLRNGLPNWRDTPNVWWVRNFDLASACRAIH
jgi:hypothetical protein